MSFLEEDSLATAAAKEKALEAFLSLLTKDCNFQEFMRQVLNIVLQSVQSEAGSLLEVDVENNILFFRAAEGFVSDQLESVTVPMGKGVAGFVAESKQPSLVNQVGESAIHLKAIAKTVGFEPKCLVAVPLIIRGQVFGVLELINRTGAESYSDADFALVQSLAESAAKTIEVRLMIGWAMSKQVVA